MIPGHLKRGEHQAKCEALLSWPHNLIRTHNGSSVYYQGCQNWPQLHCCQHQHHWLTSSSLQSSSSPESRFHPPGRSLLHRQPTGNQAGSRMWSEQDGGFMSALKMMLTTVLASFIPGIWRTCSHPSSPHGLCPKTKKPGSTKKCNKETQIFQDGSQPLAWLKWEWCWGAVKACSHLRWATINRGAVQIRPIPYNVTEWLLCLQKITYQP